MAALKLFLSLAILFVAVSAKNKTCKKKVPKFKQCLKNGYRPQILEDCPTQGEEMKGKKKKKCLEIEQVVAKKCKSFQCEQNEVRFHIRGPKYYAQEVGQGSSITCSVAAPEFDETFEMYVNGIHTSDLCEEGSAWCSAGFNRSNWTYSNGTVETSINGFVEEFTAGHNETYIECTSYKYNGSISEWISLRPDNSTDNNTDTEVKIVFEGPEYFDRELGQSSSVICSIYAPEYDDNFHMYVNGIHTSDLCAEGSPWCRAGFYNANWTYDDGTVETYVHGEVDRLTLAHNDTIIKCVSYKYDKELYARIILHSDNSTDNNTDVRFHIRGPKYYAREVGQGSSITCSVAAPEFDETFEMYVNDILYDDLCEEGSPWCSAGFNRSIWTYDNGTVETSINGFVDEFTAGHNETHIECASYKYKGSVSEWISLRPDNSTDNNTEVRFHIRGPKYYAQEVGQGSSITCSVAAPEFDETFEMYVNGVHTSDLCAENMIWCDAGFNRSIWTYSNGTVETSINGFVDEFTAGHNGTHIECASYKYKGSVSEWISLRPDNSTDNNTGSEISFEMGDSEINAEVKGIEIKRKFEALLRKKRNI